MGLFSLLFSLKGRINRAQYWLGNIGVAVASWVLVFLLTLSAGATLSGAKSDPVAALQALAPLALLFAAIMGLNGWIGFALQIKRFHDRGQSGWLAMLPCIPMAGAMSTLFSAVIESWTAERLAHALQMPMLIMMLIGLAFFINLGCLPGAKGPNKHGDPPGGPRLASPSSTAPAGPAATANALLSAQAAIDRAIAEQGRTAPNVKASARPAPAGVAAGASFGRRVR